MAIRGDAGCGNLGPVNPAVIGLPSKGFTGTETPGIIHFCLRKGVTAACDPDLIVMSPPRSCVAIRICLIWNCGAMKARSVIPFRSAETGRKPSPP